MSKLDVSKITKGEARVHCEHYRCPATDEYETDLRVIVGKETIATMPEDCGEEDPELIAEAFNVTNDTGMGPREMKEKLEEAVRLLMDARDKVWNARLDEARRWGSELEQAKVHANKHTKEFDDFLSTLTK